MTHQILVLHHLFFIPYKCFDLRFALDDIGGKPLDKKESTSSVTDDKDSATDSSDAVPGNDARNIYHEIYMICFMKKCSFTIFHFTCVN